MFTHNGKLKDTVFNACVSKKSQLKINTFKFSTCGHTSNTLFLFDRKITSFFLFLFYFLEQQFVLPQETNHDQFKTVKSMGQIWPTACLYKLIYRAAAIRIYLHIIHAAFTVH